MEAPWKARLRQIIADRGLDMKTVSLRAGLGATAVSQLLRGPHQPGVDNLKAIAEALGLTLSELYDGREQPRQVVDIIGHVDGSGPWVAGNHEAIDLRIEGGEPVGILVVGDALQPRHQHGDVLIGPRQVGRHLDNLIGVECIIETTKGERIVRFLARSASAGHFKLRSINPTVSDLDPVKIAWAAPIRLVKRG